MPWVPRTYMSAAGIQSETSKLTLGRLAGTEVSYQRQIERYRHELDDLIHEVDRDKKLLKGSMLAYSRKAGDVKTKRQKHKEEMFARMRKKVKDKEPDLSRFFATLSNTNEGELEENVKAVEKNDIHKFSLFDADLCDDAIESPRNENNIINLANKGEDHDVGKSKTVIQTHLVESVVEEYSDREITMSGKKNFSKILSDNPVKRPSSVKFQRLQKNEPTVTQSLNVQQTLTDKQHARPSRISIHEIQSSPRPKKRTKKNDQLFMELLRIKQKQGLSKRLSIVDKISKNIVEELESGVKNNTKKHFTQKDNTQINNESFTKLPSNPKRSKNLVVTNRNYSTKSPEDNNSKDASNIRQSITYDVKELEEPSYNVKGRQTFADTVQQAIAVHKRRTTISDNNFSHLLRPSEALENQVAPVHVRYTRRSSLGPKSFTLPMDKGSNDKISWQTALQKVRECHYLSQTDN